jgi:hypothetical protein
MARRKDHRKTASGRLITDDLVDELAAKAETGYDVEGATLPDGYLLPEGTTLADVRRLELELLASEGLDIEDLEAGHGQEEDRPAQQ